jgi:hypothetical protein
LPFRLRDRKEIGLIGILIISGKIAWLKNVNEKRYQKIINQGLEFLKASISYYIIYSFLQKLRWFMSIEKCLHSIFKV